LANTKDINSTERLLNVIRGTSKSPATSEDKAGNASNIKKTTNKQTITRPKAFTGKHRYTIGVDIAEGFINLAKVTKISDGKPFLVDQKVIKLRTQPAISPSEYVELLRSSLVEFVGSIEACEIWTTMSSADVNVHHIKIPRVPKKQLENVIYWTAKKENPIDEKEMIFDFEIQGEIIDQGIPKYSVMVYSAPRSEVERIKLMFSSAGVSLAGITVAPFALQNFFRTKWIDSTEKTYASLFIGNDFSRIDVYSNQNLVMTRGIKTGISSMMEVIEDSIADADPEDKPNKEQIQKFLSTLLLTPEKATVAESGLEWMESGIFELIAPVLERLIRQVERTLEYYTSSVGYEKVEKLYVSSIINLFYSPFLNYVSDQLGTKAEFFDPFEGKNVSESGGSIQPAMKALLIQAIGLSLSDRKYTPNIIFTYIEKNKEISQRRINRAIFATFGVLLMICLAVLFFQSIETKKLNDRRVQLEKQLAAYHPILSKDKINRLAEDIKMRRQINRQYAQKYRSVALIGELSALTPNSIKLINIRMTSPHSQTSENKKDAQTQDKDEGITIEGVVLGDRSQLDSILTQYIVSLERSPMLQSVNLQKSNIVNHRKKEILHFSIHAKIG